MKLLKKFQQNLHSAVHSDRVEELNIFGFRVMNRIRLFLFSIFLLLSLAGCSHDQLQVTAKFSNTQDVEEGTTVYLGDSVIGSVSDISKTQYGSVVQLSLDTELASQVSHRAAVVVNRLRQGAPLELHNPPGTLRKSIEDGQQIEALDSMMQLLGWGVSGTVAAGADSITEFREYLQSDDFQREKAEVGIAIDQGLKSAKDSLSEAEQALAEVISEVELSEQELAEVVKEVGEEMAPMVRELSQSGAELMVELERFAKNLENKSESEQQSGEAFLRSLTQALDLLNRNVEQGLEQGFDEESGEAQ